MTDDDRAQKQPSGFADALIPIIGSPFYSREGVLLYHDDCQRVLAALAQAQVTAQSDPYIAAIQHR